MCEIESIILAFEGRIKHLGLNSIPKRKTLSDVNRTDQAMYFAVCTLPKMNITVNYYLDLLNSSIEFIDYSKIYKLTMVFFKSNVRYLIPSKDFY
ncbi:MAG: hypothetical protein RO257_14520 [Candidatus Kapabacteria bacterium]|nr:hypothetical protein [Candidatus Kapabacteria bacterium]